MTFSNVLEVIIGLVLVYYALGLVVNWTMGLIKDMLDMRAVSLEKVLKEVLVCGEYPLYDNLMNHPLITHLRPMKHKMVNMVNKDQPPKVGSIPDRTFSLTLLNLLGSTDLLVTTIKDMIAQLPDEIADKTVKDSMYDALRKVDSSTIYRLQLIIMQMPDSQPRAKLLSLIDLLDEDPATQMARVKAGIESLPESATKEALKGLINFSLDDVDKARIKIEHWYDDIMDNVKAEFLGQIRRWLYVVAFIIVAIIGTDSLLIAQTLWLEPLRRAAVVEAVPGFLEEVNQGLDAVEGTAPPENTEEFVERVKARADEIDNVVEQLQKLDIPVTWWQSPVPETGIGWFARIMGILITTVAAAQGSSFWYDVLKKVNPTSTKKTSG
ncbi:MAG: hypothetical protein AAF629_16390 [Chloroflexota bacterium]